MWSLFQATYALGSPAKQSTIKLIYLPLTEHDKFHLATSLRNMILAETKCTKIWLLSEIDCSTTQYIFMLLAVTPIGDNRTVANDCLAYPDWANDSLEIVSWLYSCTSSYQLTDRVSFTLHCYPTRACAKGLSNGRLSPTPPNPRDVMHTVIPLVHTLVT